MTDEIKAPEVNVWAQADTFHVDLEFETDAHRAEVRRLRADVADLRVERDQYWRMAREHMAERDALAARLAQAERVVEALAVSLDWVRTDACALCASGTCSAHQPAAGVIAAVDALDGTAGPGEGDDHG